MYGRGVRNPTTHIIGRTHQVSLAPPVRATSVMFITASMEIMEISDMPRAVFNAILKAIRRKRTIVSRAKDVRSPLMMARTMIAFVGQGIPVTWKKAMVPISPMEQPARHQSVLYEARRQVWWQPHSMFNRSVVAIILAPINIGDFTCRKI